MTLQFANRRDNIDKGKYDVCYRMRINLPYSYIAVSLRISGQSQIIFEIVARVLRYWDTLAI